jgi:hypothetical protein
MSTNDRPTITDYSHPADDPAQIEAMRMALALRDMPVARLIAAEVVDARRAWEREHPAGRGACDPEEEPCGACAAAYSEAYGDGEAAESGEER